MKYVIPIIVTSIILYALKMRTEIYKNFIAGAEEGMRITAGIFPSLLAVVTAASMLRASGAIDLLTQFISPLTDLVHIPPGVIPLALIRPVSGSGALGVLSDILQSYGADSSTGRIASVIMGSTETTFYCLCVYFAQTKVKYTKKVIFCAIAGDIISILAGVFTINLGIF